MTLLTTIRGNVEQLAIEVVARLYTDVPGLTERYGPGGRDKCVQDNVYHLVYLAEAVATDSIDLFVDYTLWVRRLFRALRIDEAHLAANLRVTDQVLSGRLDAVTAERVRACLRAALAAMDDPQARPLSSGFNPKGRSQLADRYLDALLNGQHRQARDLVVTAVEEGMALQDLYIDVFQTTQREVGNLWHANQISVAQEHYCTAATRSIMAQLNPYFPDVEANGWRAVTTCIGGELHELGMLMVNDFLEMAGWTTYYLGAGSPQRDVLDAIRRQRPHLVGISVTIAAHLQTAEALIREIRQLPEGGNIRILVGGYPFLVAKDLWKSVGADATARDARSVLTVAEGLMVA